MNRFNVGDILRSKQPNFSEGKYIHILILQWIDTNEYHTQTYKVLSLGSGIIYDWNAAHVESQYKRVS
jgi:hypothetical protein